jgi:tetratricopeptide (TPR) repeat protein
MSNLASRFTEEQVAAAQLRVVLDEKLGRQTPDVVLQIARVRKFKPSPGEPAAKSDDPTAADSEPFAEAEAAARTAIDTLPYEPDLLVELGWVHGDQANYDEALTWFDKALQIHPRNKTALQWRVTALRRLRRFAEAEAAARTAIDTLPHEPDLLVELGWVHGDQANYDEALTWFDKALQIDPRNKTALQWRVTALRRLRRFAEAEAAARTAIDTLPHEPNLVDPGRRVRDPAEIRLDLAQLQTLRKLISQDDIRERLRQLRYLTIELRRDHPQASDLLAEVKRVERKILALASEVAVEPADEELSDVFGMGTSPEHGGRSTDKNVEEIDIDDDYKR